MRNGFPRGRLAPSPTGVLHLGNARSFLLAWLAIRSRGGTIVLRIEDLDGPRIKQGAAAAAIEDLRWLGLDWDEGPFLQSERRHTYARALQALIAERLAYPCVCTRSEVESSASAPHGPADDGPRYPGLCRGRWSSPEQAKAETGRDACIRFVAPPGVVSFDDAFRGPVAFDVQADVGDFVIAKRDGTPAYQLAVVVDDAEMCIDEVLRGDDLLTSTSRQLLLYAALSLKAPRFAHVPLLVGEDGRRLAKRHGDTTIARFRGEGMLPQALVGWLAWTSGLAPRGARVMPRDLIDRFDLALIPKEPIVVPADVDR